MGPRRCFSFSLAVRITARRFPYALSIMAAGMMAACDTTGMRRGTDSILDLFAEPSPAEAVELAMDKYDADKRYRGTLILSTQPFAGEEVYMRLFLDNARDADPGVRTVATRAVGNNGGPEHAAVLIERLTDEDRLVRIEAARGLQRIHSTAAVDPLIAAIDPEKEPEAAVRSEASDALGQYAQNKVLEALISSLDDTNLAVNSRTLSSLKILTGQDFGFDRRAWLDWYKVTRAPFVARSVYTFPAFSREKQILEYLPFFPQPPNEASTSPVGMELPSGG
ncbi:MAG: HEAT repeat domain-containing protein [Phycisphaeraceae bacterium]|nr:HEAT repeat domain-containing protein [Phycisphaerae bacterium]MBX3393572.1 HEAT repeat domain-containing protein [Phycisphaeraceae bacterium]HRJ49189.1 HEAT repeat domain-containing protein [Phycisphaerales bacterium]